MTERIERVGIRWNNHVYSVPQPGRHHDVIRHMSARGLGPECMHDQGFVTDTARFVDRFEALAIAKESKQIITRKGETAPLSCDRLYSEDVW